MKLVRSKQPKRARQSVRRGARGLRGGGVADGGRFVGGRAAGGGAGRCAGRGVGAGEVAGQVGGGGVGGCGAGEVAGQVSGGGVGGCGAGEVPGQVGRVGGGGAGGCGAAAGRVGRLDDWLDEAVDGLGAGAAAGQVGRLGGGSTGGVLPPNGGGACGFSRSGAVSPSFSGASIGKSLGFSPNGASPSSGVFSMRRKRSRASSSGSVILSVTLFS